MQEIQSQLAEVAEATARAKYRINGVTVAMVTADGCLELRATVIDPTEAIDFTRWVREEFCQ